MQQKHPLHEITNRIVEAARITYQEFGPGCEKVVYRQSLASGLSAQGLEFSCDVWIDTYYRGRKAGRKCMDFSVDKILVKLDTRPVKEDVNFAHTLTYLRMSGYTVALFLNFGTKKLSIKRIINDKRNSE